LREEIFCASSCGEIRAEEDFLISLKKQRKGREIAEQVKEGVYEVRESRLEGKGARKG